MRFRSTVLAKRFEDPANGLERKKELLLVCFAVVYAVAFALILSRQTSILIHSDFLSRWYPTTKLVFEQRSLYDPRNGEEIVALNPQPPEPYFASFAYPATLLIFTLPLAFLKFPAAHFIWLVAIQCFLIFGIYILARLVHWPNSTNRLTILLMLSLFFIPNFQNTIWGQFDTIALISFALTYRALVKGKDLQAGIWAAGLTFKPQVMLLCLVFLILWALFNRKHWPFLAGFGLASLGLWAFAEMLEPGWVGSFVHSTLAYPGYFKPISALELAGIHGAWAPGALLSAAFIVFLAHRKAEPGSAEMAGWLVLGAAAWWMVIPIMGMMHMLLLPAILTLLFASLARTNPRIERYGVIGFLCLYGLGLAGFFYGLSSPAVYGLHIQLPEMAYKFAVPILTGLLAVPLLSRRASQASTEPVVGPPVEEPAGRVNALADAD